MNEAEETENNNNCPESFIGNHCVVDDVDIGVPHSGPHGTTFKVRGGYIRMTWLFVPTGV